MADGEQGNQTSLTEFILLGFRSVPELQILLFLLFLVIYIVTMAGNIVIVVLVVTDQHLHTPMYFFLGNLSCLETCYTSTILPRILVSLLTGDKTISVGGCITQGYFVGFFAATECYLLAAMSYDQYLAICKPLHYATLMNGSFCLQLEAGSWIRALLASSIVTGMMLLLTFCGPNEIDHFFCESIQIINLYHNHIYQVELLFTILSSLFTLPPFALTGTSYLCIIHHPTIPFHHREGKGVFYCSSHLIVVIIFYGTLIIVCLLPTTNTLRDLSKVSSVFYAILTPIVNPFIYSLRNKEVKEALRKKNASKCVD